MPERVSETATLTAVNLTIIGAMIVLVIVAMIWGARLKRRRKAAEKIEEKRLEEAGVAPPGAKEAHRPLRDADATDQPHPATPEPSSSAPVPPPPEPEPMPEPAAEPPVLADAPVAAASAFEASPASKAEPTPARPAASEAGDALPVTQLKGLGPKVAARLAELGITDVGQLAALDDAAAADLDARLGSFRGRMARDRWIEQARLLAAGDRAGFEATFGKL